MVTFNKSSLNESVIQQKFTKKDTVETFHTIIMPLKISVFWKIDLTFEQFDGEVNARGKQFTSRAMTCAVCLTTGLHHDLSASAMAADKFKTFLQETLRHLHCFFILTTLQRIDGDTRKIHGNSEKKGALKKD